MKLLLLLLLINVVHAHGSIVFTIGDSVVVFTQESNMYVNKACSRKCQAFVKGKEFKSVNIPAQHLAGGKNPGSVRCSLLMKGKVVIGSDREGNQQSFCLFSDNSYLMN